MDCDRDEAARAKEIAEKKFKEGDIAGAKKIALEAQSLSPELKGLPQFMEILDMYICGEKKINGEVDCYGVLGVDPLADDETLHRRYRKLALDLHPDKNKSFGAEGAFKILSEAWSLLSDKAQRVAYDQKLNPRATYKENINRNASATDGTNGSDTSTHNNGSSLTAQKTTANTHPTPSFTHSSSSFNPQNTTASHQPTPVPPCLSKSITFWTECNQCNMQYQYFRVHFNQQVLCLNCQKPFYAIEIPSLPPPNSQRNVDHHVENKSTASRINLSFNPNAGIPGSAGVGSTKSPNVQQSSFFASGSFGSVPASAGENANVVHPACQNLKRGREDGQTAGQRNCSAHQKTDARLTSNAGSTSGKGVGAMKKRRTEVNVGGVQMPNQMGMGNGGAGRRNVSGYQKGSSGLCTERVNTTEAVKRNSVRGLPQLAMRNLLMAKSRMEIQKKLKEWSSEAALKSSNKEGKVMEMEKAKTVLIGVPKAAVDGGKKDGSKDAEIMETKKPVRPKKSSLATSNDNSNEKATDVKLMSVPDPDFYDFDKDRMEKSFGGNQVWAAYDDEDGMPRYYALIHNVISKKPFKMQISWLNSKTNAELGPLDWVASGFPKTSGDFRVGKYEVYKNLNSFSHIVKWTKGPKGVICIFPKKGDVWALYRNWSPEWNELTPDEVIYKYDVVEVLEDYNEEKGVVVAALVKVVGFKSVFRQHLDPAEVQTIPREEMFRLSHQVPSYILTGQEAHNAPKGSLELDPAALPLELLEVITEEAKTTVTMENAKKATENDAAKGAGKAMEDLHLEESSKSISKDEVIENLKKGDTTAMARNAKGPEEEEEEEEEEEMVKNPIEARE